MKLCKKCGLEKEISDFCKDKNGKDGHSNMCKSCKREYDSKIHKELKHEPISNS